MRIPIAAILTAFLLGGPLGAAPMKVIYNSTSTAHFGPVWSRTIVSTKVVEPPPAPVVEQWVTLPDCWDLSAYRYYRNDPRAFRNDWGYFFPRGVRLSPQSLYFLSQSLAHPVYQAFSPLFTLYPRFITP